MRQPVMGIPAGRRRCASSVTSPLGMALVASALVCSGCGDVSPEPSELYRAPAVPNHVDDVIFEAGNWEPHLPAGETGVSWGNHRAVVVLEEGAADPPPTAVLATIRWRRRDADPGSKGIVVVDAATGEAVSNALPLRVENVSGDIVFQPNPGSREYHVYYLPWQSTGGYYPTVTYPTQEEIQAGRLAVGVDRTSPSRADAEGRAALSWEGLAPSPDPEWLEAVRESDPKELPRARTTRIQSVDEFHSFFPMEIIATPEEVTRFMEDQEDGWALVPEHRDNPVRMRHFIPQHWVSMPVTSRMPPLPNTPSNGPRGTEDLPPFASRVLRNEAFTFQLALVSGEEPLRDVRVEFADFPPDWPATALTCFNCEGTDEKGQAFTRRIDIPRETVQPLWLGIRVPADQSPGPVEGKVTVISAHRGSKTIGVTLEVQPGVAPGGGDEIPELMTRLVWLNSTVGTDRNFIIEPFEPVRAEAVPADAAARTESGLDETTVASLHILGRRVELGPSGLPNQIFSFFTPELTGFGPEPDPILGAPLALEVKGDRGTVAFRWHPPEPRNAGAGRSEWTATGTSDRFSMRVDGALEYDGMLDYRITLVALADVAVEDIVLPVYFREDAADYMLGLGYKGGARPERVEWRWAIDNHQEGVWLGAVNKGLQYVLRDENYVRPLNTNFYRNQPLNMPPSWFNEGRGGIRIGEIRREADPAMAPPAGGRQAEAGGDPDPGASTFVLAENYSGPRTLSAGDTLHFNIRFLITPFKPIDTREHFNTRFVHQYVPVDSVVAWGGTVVNIHHANEINPYINYPFFNLELQAAYIEEAHSKGVKVKLYNTIRELTYRAHELFALRSLGDEILNDGEGGGHSWMQEHLEDHYHSAWHAWRVDDAAMLNKGTSRWTNYYVEGLSWLAEHQHIDGLYLDDIAFSRETVKRMVTVLHEHRDQVVIDLHSANQFNVRDGFINSAMLYMEHLPFINRLWFGEYFEYDRDPEYWMTEVSGLPFGLMGEMLQDGGHPYRGLLYGMTARKYGDVDPRPVWALMNEFGMAESRMLGYWLPDPPVRTGNPEILATAYVRDGSTLIALASWADEDVQVDLEVDWEKLGFSGENLPGSGGRAGNRATLPPGWSARTPPVAGLQDAASVNLSALRVPARMGLWVIVEKE